MIEDSDEVSSSPSSAMSVGRSGVGSEIVGFVGEAEERERCRLMISALSWSEPRRPEVGGETAAGQSDFSSGRLCGLTRMAAACASLSQVRIVTRGGAPRASGPIDAWRA
jgi:hypothetical protein